MVLMGERAVWADDLGPGREKAESSEDELPVNLGRALIVMICLLKMATYMIA